MSALTNIRDTIVRVSNIPRAYFMGEWERMAPRTRRTVAWLAIGCLALFMLFATRLAFSSISDLEEGNADIREALQAIAKHRDEYLEAKARNAIQEARIGNDPPQLTGDLEAAARGENVQIAESSERPAVPAGRRYVQHDVDLKVREVDLQSLTKFLKRVETGPRLIVVTRISLKRRYSEADKLDVELTATAFEKVKEDKSKKKPDGKPGKEKGSN
jgi:general secretion pathway protein M